MRHPLVESAIDYHSIKCQRGGDLEEPLVGILHEGDDKVIGRPTKDYSDRLLGKLLVTSATE